MLARHPLEFFLDAVQVSSDLAPGHLPGVLVAQLGVEGLPGADILTDVCEPITLAGAPLALFFRVFESVWNEVLEKSFG